MQPAWPKCYAFRIPNEVQQLECRKVYLETTLPALLSEYFRVFSTKEPDIDFQVSIVKSSPNHIFAKTRKRTHAKINICGELNARCALCFFHEILCKLPLCL